MERYVIDSKRLLCLFCIALCVPREPSSCLTVVKRWVGVQWLLKARYVPAFWVEGMGMDFNPFMREETMDNGFWKAERRSQKNFVLNRTDRGERVRTHWGKGVPASLKKTSTF